VPRQRGRTSSSWRRPGRMAICARKGEVIGTTEPRARRRARRGAESTRMAACSGVFADAGKTGFSSYQGGRARGRHGASAAR